MASLENTTPASTYPYLLQIPNGILSTAVDAETGSGFALPVSISTTQIDIDVLKVSGNTIPYQVSANKLLGSTTGSTAAIGEVSIGTGLSLSSGTLSNTLVGLSSVVTTYTSGSGTYTPTAGMKWIRVFMLGGGGGGGGVENGGGGNYFGSGGSSGSFLEFIMTAAQVGASKSYSVGTGGSGGSDVPSHGTAGGNTTFGDWTAGGGGRGLLGNLAGGAALSSDASTTNTVGTGTVIRNITGFNCSNVCVNLGSTILIPGGAVDFTSPTPLCSPITRKRRRTPGSIYTGSAGVNAGQGGAGAHAISAGVGTAAGGDGANGVIIIEEYF